MLTDKYYHYWISTGTACMQYVCRYRRQSLCYTFLRLLSVWEPIGRVRWTGLVEWDAWTSPGCLLLDYIAQRLYRIVLQCAPLVRLVKLARLRCLSPPLHSPWHCRTLDSRVYKSFFSRTLELLCVRRECKKGRTMSQPSPRSLAKQSQFLHFVSAYDVIASDRRWWEGWRWKQTANNI